ncbi:GNAT family acetyltransferase [Talaromyces pinophilus]|uniref:GNAT family acetyltransferase n=1 Tax=Talaromyces pinophilus TaxID=128442 RepID=A0A6V8HM54_TALPI|nr:GNAT family acetyltransferase [Talaromyces pinophilus]
MAYQVFAKAQAQQRTATNTTPTTATSPPLSPPSLLAKQPPLHPAPLVLPQSATSSSSNTHRPPSIGDPNFTPEPFSEPLTSYQTPHPHVTIDPVRTAHIPSLSRITGLLLPIRYPSSFYTACITDPVIASLSRVAVYHDHPVPSGPSTETTFGGAHPSTPSTAGGAGLGGTDKVIGGIRCRLERLFPEFSGLNGQDSRPPPTNLYIQTLHLLSPHRGNGVAASLLNSLLFAKPPSGSSKSYRVSSLVRHYNIHSVTAHVHETNDEGLRWYVARGFHVEDGVVKGYYRRLNPGGARIVRLDLDWDNDEQEEDRKDTPQEDLEQSLQSSDVSKATKSANEEQSDDDEDDDWEKLEAEEDDADDHGVVHLTDSQILDDNSPISTTSSSGKRKRDLEHFQKRHK